MAGEQIADFREGVSAIGVAEALNAALQLADHDPGMAVDFFRKSLDPGKSEAVRTLFYECLEVLVGNQPFGGLSVGLIFVLPVLFDEHVMAFQTVGDFMQEGEPEVVDPIIAQ